MNDNDKTDIPDPTNGRNEETPSATNAPQPVKQKKPKFSGDYWYSEATDDELKKQSFTRTLIYVIALLLQITVLVLPQGGLEYATKNIPSYAYVYMWLVFVTIGVSLYVIITGCTCYKIQKRIPKERAPKHGFKRRTFLGAEIAVGVYVLLFAVELSFVCISFDGAGLAATLLCLAAAAATVWARQITIFSLRDATLVKSDAPQNQ